MMIRLSLLILLVAPSVSAAADPIPLRAGPLSMVFEPDSALLRYVTLDDYKVLQGINAPVRNQFWGTVPPVVENILLRDHGDSFDLTFDVSCREGDIDFFWRGGIKGSSGGRVVFTFDGEARTTFLRNRIGFCVLHGPEAAGRPCAVETTDGAKVQSRFPRSISPHQPFKNIRAISHELAEGVWAHVRMEGDTFEMEDQRNWTDASFKTYCTPLELPYPARVEKGTKISHRIELSVDGVDRIAAKDAGKKEDVVLRVSEVGVAGKTVPRIGLGLSSQVETLSELELERLRLLQLDHLRVDLHPSEPTAAAELRRAAREAGSLGVDLHVALHLGESAAEELKSLTAELEATRPAVAVWLVISPGAERLRLARDFLKRHAPGAPVGTGEDTNFTELNRNRPDAAGIDLVSYGLNPQVHAFDDTSLVETLAMQAETVRTAREFVGDLPLLVSPITLRPQRVHRAPPTGELPSNVDPRQPSLFAAAWTLGSLKYLAESGVHGVTYFETVGWLGVMEAESGSPLPRRFPSSPGMVFPVYHVLRDVGEFSGGRVHACASTDPMAVIGLALERGERTRVLLANVSTRERRVTLEGVKGRVRVRRLDAGRVASAISSPEGFRRRFDALGAGADGALKLELPPYGLACLDGSD